jgi:hypothetical protein
LRHTFVNIYAASERNVTRHDITGGTLWKTTRVVIAASSRRVCRNVLRCELMEDGEVTFAATAVRP